MRRIALSATLALIIIASALAALASAGAPTTVTIDSHITPVIRNFTTKTTSAKLAVNLKFAGEGGQLASTLQRAVLKFGYGARLNGRLFPSCSAQMIRDGKRCPRGSRIGGGTALGMLADVQEPITVDLYNGPKGRSITFLIKGDRPAVINVPFDAPLKTMRGGDYNYELTVDVPEILQRIVGVDVSLDFFNVTVGASRRVKRKKVGYIETLICPPGALVPLSAAFTFLEAAPYSTDTYIHCG